MTILVKFGKKYCETSLQSHLFRLLSLQGAIGLRSKREKEKKTPTDFLFLNQERKRWSFPFLVSLFYFCRDFCYRPHLQRDYNKKYL